MLMEIGITLVVVMVVMAVLLAKRPARDLGAVSASWIAQNRMDTR